MLAWYQDWRIYRYKDSTRMSYRCLVILRMSWLLLSIVFLFLYLPWTSPIICIVLRMVIAKTHSRSLSIASIRISRPFVRVSLHRKSRSRWVTEGISDGLIANWYRMIIERMNLRHNKIIFNLKQCIRCELIHSIKSQEPNAHEKQYLILTVCELEWYDVVVPICE